MNFENIDLILNSSFSEVFSNSQVITQYSANSRLRVAFEDDFKPERLTVVINNGISLPAKAVLLSSETISYNEKDLYFYEYKFTQYETSKYVELLELTVFGYDENGLLIGNVTLTLPMEKADFAKVTPATLEDNSGLVQMIDKTNEIQDQLNSFKSKELTNLIDSAIDEHNSDENSHQFLIDYSDKKYEDGVKTTESKINEHNINENSHQYLQSKIESRYESSLTNANVKIADHNNSILSHSDIRNEIKNNKADTDASIEELESNYSELSASLSKLSSDTLDASRLVNGKINDNLLSSNIALSNKNNLFSTSQTIMGDLQIEGNIIQKGESFITKAETITTPNDYIILRNEAISGLSTGSYSGLEFFKYDGTNSGRLAVDNDGVVRVGDIGLEQPLATREENPISGGFAKWNSNKLRFETDTNVASMTYVDEKNSYNIKKDDYASDTKAGIVRLFQDGRYGIGNSSENGLIISAASEEDIKNKITEYKPITPSNLDFAVKESLTTNREEWSNEDKKYVRNLISAVGSDNIPKINFYNSIPETYEENEVFLIPGENEIIANPVLEGGETILSSIEIAGNKFKLPTTKVEPMVFNSYEELVSYFNKEEFSSHEIGQSIYIIEKSVPDLWISEISDIYEEFIFSDNESFIEELTTNGSIKIGYFAFSGLETEKVNLEGAATKAYVDEQLETKVTNLGSGNSVRVYCAETSGKNHYRALSSTSSNCIVLRPSGGRLYTPTPKENTDCANKKYVDDSIATLGSQITAEIDSSTYVMTLKLLNSEGTELSSGTVDLPLETVVISARYDAGKLYLKTRDGNELDGIDISAIVSGLVPNTRTVNGKALSGNITLSAGDVGAYTKTEADTIFLKSVPDEYVTETELGNKSYATTTVVNGIGSRVTALESSLEGVEELLAALNNGGGV